VLGDSGVPKDTHTMLKNVKSAALEAVAHLRNLLPSFDLHTTTLEEIRPFLKNLAPRLREVLEANLIDRDLLVRARFLLAEKTLDHRAFGSLLTRHHEQLSRKKRISTGKIDRMLDAALNAGALGGKINGSGGGGCMFAYAPNEPESVAEAIRTVGGKAYVVRIREGLRDEGPNRNSE
ncbi:MAG: GHMP kinase, partial [Hyphomicrobiales bacterium]|nr:GHMP kinase [Hyphomicrobiales bacterium]